MTAAGYVVGLLVFYLAARQCRLATEGMRHSALAAAAIFGTLFALRGRMPREGDLFKLYLVLYGASRFGLEFLRERNLAFGGLSLAQWVCLEMAMVASLALVVSSRHARAALPA